MKKTATPMLLVLLALSAAFHVQQQKKLGNAIKISNLQEDSLRLQQALIDSLRTEDFIHSTNETRYGIALDWLKEEAPACAARFEKILATKTE